jgi:hypothetical protein
MALVEPSGSVVTRSIVNLRSVDFEGQELAMTAIEKRHLEGIHMQTATEAVPQGKKKRWVGRTLSALAALFLLVDGAMKIMKAPVAVKGTLELGYPEGVVVGIGVVLIACTLLYVIPRTAMLGAILLTGYLGGAVGTHVRVGNPLFSHVLFPVYIGVLIWGGLVLCEDQLRALLFPPAEGSRRP